ncbi:unnamed protein product [Rhizophagus irregularis]|nr:unnamed protein product [Rhizophagus irregularis]
MTEVQVWEHVLKWGIAQYPENSTNELYIELLKLFLNNNYRPSTKKIIDSKIIKNQHAELISKWIDRLEITDELKSSYKFKLIFRESRNGFTARQFHKVCDNQSRTVAIIKVQDTNEIFGGYNPIEWKNNYSFINNYGTTKDNFIFSFMKENIENHIISRMKNEK